MSISVRLSPEIELKLGALARETGQSRCFHVKRAIQEYLEDLDDYIEAQTL